MNNKNIMDKIIDEYYWHTKMAKYIIYNYHRYKFYGCKNNLSYQMIKNEVLKDTSSIYCILFEYLSEALNIGNDDENLIISIFQYLMCGCSNHIVSDNTVDTKFSFVDVMAKEEDDYDIIISKLSNDIASYYGDIAKDEIEKLIRNFIISFKKKEDE